MAMTAPKPRFLELDAVRGFAVMGILAMNIVGFAMPTSAYMNPTAFGGAQGIDLWTWIFNFILVDSKMRGLFTILFGASAMLVIERAMASGQSAAKVHYSRMIWLLVFGLIHHYFIWWGDILALYALCGLVLFFFRNLSARAMMVWGVGLIAVTVLMFGAVFAQMLGLQSAVATGGLSADELTSVQEALAGFDKTFGAAPAMVASDLELYRSSYSAIVANRLGSWTDPFAAVSFMGTETLGQMLIGASLYKSGFLTGERPFATYRRTVQIGGALAVPILSIIALYVVLSGFDAIATFGGYIVLSLPFDVLLAVAYAALFIMACKAAPGSALIRRVAAAGRAAFTNYLGTSIVMTTVFYGYGLGLFGEVNRAALYPFVFAMWGLMLLWSQPWLMRFRYGPLEWLWRSLAKLRPQKMRL